MGATIGCKYPGISAVDLFQRLAERGYSIKYPKNILIGSVFKVNKEQLSAFFTIMSSPVAKSGEEGSVNDYEYLLKMKCRLLTSQILCDKRRRELCASLTEIGSVIIE